MDATSQRVIESFRATLDLFQAGTEMMRQNLRRRHPQATEQEIDQLFDQWLHERPGAETGDCQGRVVDVHARLENLTARISTK